MSKHIRLLIFVLGALEGCSSTPPLPSPAHLQQGALPSPERHIPPTVTPTPPPARPAPSRNPQTYSVVVDQVSIRDLLFALARDARLNIDIHPGLAGKVTLNAVDQTLPQILNRLSRQADLRFELDGSNLSVMPDLPFLRHYRVDYLNVARSVSGTVATNTQIATSGTGVSVTNAAGLPAGSPGGGNISATRIENLSRNQFWDSLEKNIRDLLRETDKLLPEGSSETTTESQETTATSGTGVAPQPQAQPRTRGRTGTTANPLLSSPNPASMNNTTTTVVHKSTYREAAAVIAHRESGVISVRASARQHEKVQEFLEQVMSAARRQVLVEATIVEVNLSDTYRQGIEWSRVLASGTRFGLSGPTLGSSTGNTLTPFSLGYQSEQGIDSTIKLLEGFGTVKVLSSPKLSVLNNQTAVIKVVEEFVYFNVKADTTQTSNAGTLTTVTTTPQAVSVGLVMSLTPQVSEHEEVILNVRPTISSIADFRRDPNPNIPNGIANLVPQIRTREIESVLRLGNGETAILGGLMEDRIDFKTGRVPGVGALPLLGEIFTQRDHLIQKSELVIFLRPLIVREPTLLAGTPALRGLLPDRDFLDARPAPGARNFPPPSSEGMRP